jgi:hypothetical protein
MSDTPDRHQEQPCAIPEAGVDGMETAAGRPDEQKAEDTSEPNSPLAEGGMTGTGADAPRNPR